MKLLHAACAGVALLNLFAPAARAQSSPAAPPPAQTPPDTEIYLAPLKLMNGVLDVGPPVNVTNNPGYDNQPFFTPDGAAMLFTSLRGGAAQTDIYRYALAAKTVTRVTETPEAEYSPTVTPDGRISVVRVEADGTQRLWSLRASGPSEPALILPEIKPVGYHAWADDHTLALFVLGQPATLQLADTRTGRARIVASDIGRSLQPIPGRDVPRRISFVQRQRAGETARLVVNQLNPATGEVSLLTRAVEGATEADLAWTPDGTLLMAHGGWLHAWHRGDATWTRVTDLERLSLRSVSRIAVSPTGEWLALVALPAERR